MADNNSQSGQKRYRKARVEGPNDPWGGVSLDGKARDAGQKEQDSAPIHSLIDKLFGKKK